MGQNEHGQPVGDPIPAWADPPRPHDVRLEGRDVTLVDLVEEHVAGLFAAICAPEHDPLWTYLPIERPRQLDGLAAHVAGIAAEQHPLVVLDARDGGVLGTASYYNIAPGDGSIEVGHICYGPGLARTRGATEAMYLMMRHAFALGYRRYEWKCDALNAPSRRAARRLGFAYEGTFAQAKIVKDRNRDTAWYSITDHEWASLRVALEAWLDPESFGDDGRQRWPLDAPRGSREVSEPAPPTATDRR